MVSRVQLLVLLVLFIFSCLVGVHTKKHTKTFMITDKLIGDLKTYVLSNNLTGEYAEIVSDYGGRVEELYLQSQSAKGNSAQPQQVLLSHNGNATSIKENTWWQGMFLVPWANRIAYGKYTFFNSSYDLPLNENSSDPPIKNSMHGLLAGKKLNLDSATFDDQSATLVLSLQLKNEEEGYPFEWHYKITYTLSKLGLDISIVVINTMATQPLPLYIGWHPYFISDSVNKAVITFDDCTGWNHVELNDNINPTGITAPGAPFDGNTPIGGTPSTPTHYDDEYKATDPPSMCEVIETKLFDPDSKKTVVLYQSENMRFIQVFTGLSGAIAIEPMSGMADAFNNHDHLSVVSGGETWEASFGVYLK